MKILYTITGLSMGGAETITVNLAQRMQLRGHTVQIMYLSGEQIVKVPKEIGTINLCMRKTPLGFMRALRMAKRIIKEFQPDVVHANMFHAIVFSRILRLFAKIPRLICTEHSNNFHGKLRQIMEHCTDFLSDVNTNVSENATENFVKNGLFSAKKTQTVYNGIDLEHFSKNRGYHIRKIYHIADDDFLFINISRFNEAKDHKNLLKAFDIVHKKQKNTKLMLVGSGELESEIKEFCKSLDLSESVIFTGSKSNVGDFYNSADCFVLSSAWEGLPLVVAEAMGCELPVVVTTSGAEVCQNEKWVVSIKDPEALAAKMLEICNMSGDEKIELGKNNRELVKKFELSKITEKWLVLYSINVGGGYKNMIKIKLDYGIFENDFVFINVSRFNEAKDHRNLIDAFNIVHKKNQNTKLLLVGDGELRGEMQVFVDELQISDSVIFAGIHQNTEDYYNVSDCFVLSSAYEGFGLVLVEAMACELPVISTDCGGTREIVSQKSDLVPVRNPELLAEKMIEVMDFSAEQRKNIGTRNRKSVEKFDLQKITAKWEELYKGSVA